MAAEPPGCSGFPLRSGTRYQQLSEDAPRHDNIPRPWGAGMFIMDVAGMESP